MESPLLTSDMRVNDSHEAINADVRTEIEQTAEQDGRPQKVVIRTNNEESDDYFVHDSREGYGERSAPSSMPKPYLDRRLPVLAILKISFRRISWRLYLSLLLARLIPTVYKTTRVFYLGDLPDDSGVNITSQLVWVDLCQEVLQDALMLPLFYTIGVILSDESETMNRVKTGIAFTFVIHLVFAGVIVAAAEPLVEFMAQDRKLINETVTYIRLEMAAIPFDGIVQFVTVVFTLHRWQFQIYAVLVIQMTLSVVSDTFFLSQLGCSLKLGVNGIAYGNIITNCVLSSYCVTVLVVKYRTACLSSKMSFTWMRTWGSVGFYSGLDSLVRNVFYALCVVRMMNVISRQGAYFRANEFLSYWLLVPFYPLADVLKQDTGASTSPILNYKLKTAGYTVLAIIIGLVWCVSVPLWKPFFRTVMNIPNEDIDIVYDIALILVPSYVILMMNTLMDSVFIGKGRTVMLAIQSIITNIFVFGLSFVLYLCGVYTPTLWNISALFSVSIIVDSAITTGLYVWFLKHVEYEI